MRMIPSVVSERTRSDAERRVFRLLERTDLGSSAVCFHSLGLSEHDYKICAEVDFLMVTKQAITVLEVKGGGMNCVEGIWTYTNRFGRQFHTSEGPFHQARTAMFALKERIEDQFGKAAARSLAFGYAVVFPDCDFREQSVEWHSSTIVDATCLRGALELQVPLQKAMKYWEEKNQHATDLPQGFRDRLLQFLRPTFERVPSLRNRADALDAAMESLTDEQYARLDIVQSNPRILCSGGAGTGKTFLALEIARRHAASGARVLVTCFGETLAAFLRSRFVGSEVVVAPASALTASLGPFDVLVVDEGQDLTDMRFLDASDRLLERGLQGGTWRWFCDVNSQAGLSGNFDPEALGLLRSYNPVEANLTLNCRNTRDIVFQTQLLTGCDLGLPGVGEGPPVTYVYYKSTKEQVELIDQHWNHLMSEEVPPGDVTILSPRAFDSSCIRDTRLAKKCEVLKTRRGILDWPRNSITFSPISEFKGLENRFVLVVDIEGLGQNEGTRKLLYVAMTRARTGLWVAAHESMRGHIQATATENMARVIKTA